MTTQRDNVAGYFVTTDTSRYLVELRRLVNTYSGNPRFEATIFDLNKGSFNYTAGHVFRFTGHYFDEPKEAQWIVSHWEDKIAKFEATLR